MLKSCTWTFVVIPANNFPFDKIVKFKFSKQLDNALTNVVHSTMDVMEMTMLRYDFNDSIKYTCE